MKRPIAIPDHPAETPEAERRTSACSRVRVPLAPIKAPRPPAWLLAFSLAASVDCGGALAPVTAEVDGASPTPAAAPLGGIGAPCATRSNCQSGLDCGPPEKIAQPSDRCGAGWTCTDRMLCSAAAGDLRCSCDGVAFSAAGGCPGQDGSYLMGYVPQDLQPGEPCDPNNPGAFRRNLTTVLVGLASAKGPAPRIQIRISRPDGRRDGPWGANPAVDGTSRTNYEDTIRPGAGEYRIDLLLDEGADGRCDGPGDRVLSKTVVAPAYGQGGDVTVEFSAAEPSDDAACATWR